MSQLKPLQTQRATSRKSFTKAASKLEDALGKENRDLTEINSLVKLLDQRFVAMETLDGQICGCLLESSAKEKDLEVEQDRIDEYCLTYYKLKAAHDEILQREADDRKAMSGSSSVSSGNARRYKLPVLELKKFNGEIGEWLPFWGQFEKIHVDKDMDDIDKLGYLTQAMEVGSVARELVDSYPATPKMYPIVVNALTDRFGRSDLLTEYYIRGLLGIVIHNATAEDKFPLAKLYDKVQSHLRNLEILEVTTDKCAPILLPLVSSCLPREILLSWERKVSQDRGNLRSDVVLKNLLDFLKAELEGDQKLAMALSGFGLSSAPLAASENFPTAAGLLATSSAVKNCIFCGAAHKPQTCLVALSMSLAARRKTIVDKRGCFCCLTVGHPARYCRNRPRCTTCQRSHFSLVCDGAEKTTNTDQRGSQPTLPSTSDTYASISVPCNVLLETIRIKLYCGNRFRVVRALIDTGSQRTYVLRNSVDEMGYKAHRTEMINHCLFGGVNTGVVNHDVVRLFATSMNGNYDCNFEAVVQQRICNRVQPIPLGPWMNELQDNNIVLTDFEEGPIEVLIGADIAGRLLTGGHQQFECGLSAIETRLGWALIGKIPGSHTENMAMTVISMLSKDAKITDLWALDTLGIRDPAKVSDKAEVEAATLDHFIKTVAVTEDGRFEVHLPWVENHPPLPSNYLLALKRTQNTVKKLKRDGYFLAYESLLQEWLQDGVIEEVVEKDNSEYPHYLPHRHVIKLGSTTPVRPVFDASAREHRHPSLNQCLEKGPNTIERIPSALARFRMKKIGLVGDIRRAFLQISVAPRDRDYLRLLWIAENGSLKEYRHCRVVFGLSPSPFQLGACIDLHLEQVLAECREGTRNLPIDLIELLQTSFYADNCLTSLEDEDRARKFVEIATSIMQERRFDLRGWELNSSEPGPPTNVLGMLWDRHNDTLSVDVAGLLSMDFERITKRIILSAAHKVFDPLGIASCVTLVPKLLLHQTWELGLGWDDVVEPGLCTDFAAWLEDIHRLAEVKIRRWLPGTNDVHDGWSLHVFSDACQRSYGAVIFLRVQNEEQVRVQFVQAKSRVSPNSRSTRSITIPRLELLAASIAARLYHVVVKDYGLQGVETFFHTDSTTVLAWILRQEPWELFVFNRVKEIRELTDGCTWRHIPGLRNPADLPSRGCSPKKFVTSGWWEGPDWLKQEKSSWPQPAVDYNEEEINQERKKVIVSSLLCSTHDDWYYRRFSHYKMIVRMVGWIFRMKANAKLQKHMRPVGDLTAQEFMCAEYRVLKMVQGEVFDGALDPKLSGLMPFTDSHGLIRIMTKLSYRADLDSFRHPIVLTAEHPVVQRLVMDVHFENCHASVHMLNEHCSCQFYANGSGFWVDDEL